MVGTIIISLEVELAWGVQHLPDQEGMERHSPDGEQERAYLDRLLSLCDDLDLPLSFDVVGHLLLEGCEGDHDGPHEAGWFDGDPGTDSERDPLFYAPDVVDRIRSAGADHEICTHTFSHVRCDEVNREVLDWELDASDRVHERYGLPKPRSFVPPVHGPPPMAALARHGIRVARRPVQYEPPVASTPDSWLRQLTPRRPYPLQVLARRHPVRDPDVVAGVIQTYSTWHTSLTAPYLPSGQRDVHTVFRQIPVTLRQRLHDRYLRGGLDAAIEQDSHAHFWCHLFDLANEKQWPPIEAFLQKLAAAREDGSIRILTMAELADERELSSPASTVRSARLGR